MEVRAATGLERRAAVERVFGDGGAAATFLEVVETEGKFEPDDLLVAVEGGEVRGAVIAQSLPGRLAVVLSPDAHDAATEDALLRAGLARLERNRVRLALSYLELDGDTSAIQRHGFEYVTILEHRRRTGSRMVEPAGGPVLQFSRKFDRTVFGATLVATYEGSLDAPEANFDATPEEVLAGYENPSMWHLVSEGDRPVGVLLMDYWPGTGSIEYFGVIPKARGRGIGRAIVHYAVTNFLKRGVSEMAVTFDTRNVPVARLYESFGFELHRTQHLWLRRFD